MDELSAYEKFGFGGMAAMFGFQLIREGWKRWISKDYVSYKEILLIKEKATGLEAKLNGHLEKVEEKNIVIAKLETKQEYIEHTIEEMKQNQHDMFKILGEIKNMMIQKGT